MNSPDLDQPGAGIPSLERFIGNHVMRLNAWFRSRQNLVSFMESETQRIISLCGSLTPEQGQQQVLIDRFIGIEDSSRNWSVWMTVQHICIVNLSIQSIVVSLTDNQDFDQVVRIQDVKPDPSAGPASGPQLVDTVADFKATINQAKTLASNKTHVHPWFGPFNAKQWATLAAIHMGIHRKQIDKICQKLPR